MDEQKDLSVNNEEVLDNIDSSVNDEVPNVEENADTSNVNNDVNKAGNGYRGLASSNREAFSRGLSDNYNERIARNQANLNASRAKAANSKKEVETNNGVVEKDKTKLDKAKDRRDILRDEASLVSSKVDKVRAGMYAATNPKDAIEMALKAKIKTWILSGIVSFFASGVGLFVLLVAAALVLGLIKFDSQASGGNSLVMKDKECGFTISQTSLSKSEYKQKIGEYSKTHPKAIVFYENADSIYDFAVASNINPELVIVRAAVEGYSPGESFNNYWGIGCYNGKGINACKSYSSFMEGVKAYVNNISKYSSLSDMMSKYAYIGDKWEKGSSSIGGCYYFDYIKDYYDSSSEAQQSKKNAEAACAAGGTGIPTTKYDQDAYASWQVNSQMASVREKIFGLKIDEGVSCSYNTNINTSDIVEKYVVWMINLAADDSVGYSQSTRQMNPNVDCSSFVYYGLLKGAGFSVSELGGSYPFATSNMRGILKKIGFEVYNFDKSQLVRGDILWRNGHTEVYIGDGKNVGAHSNYDKRNGDSSGDEVDIGDTGTNWTSYIRYVG